MPTTVYDDLTLAGVSIWLDSLSRAMLTSGDLARHVGRRNVVGVTSNPTIFESALADGSHYDSQVAQLRAAGVDVVCSAVVMRFSVVDV